MSRMRVRLGEVEIEYDGDQKFITDGLLEFAKKFVTTLAGDAAAPAGGRT